MSTKLVTIGNGWDVLIRARLSPSHDYKSVTYEWHLFDPRTREVEEGTSNSEQGAMFCAREAAFGRASALAELAAFQ